MAEHDQILAEVTKLHPGPGDLIVVRLTKDLADEQMRQLAEDLGRALPGFGASGVIVPPFMRISVEPDPAAATTPKEVPDDS